MMIMEKGIVGIVARHLDAIKAGIVERMAQYGRNASGRSVASLEVETNEDGGSLKGLSSFLVMERGRGPGKVPANFTSIIRDWIVAKGISYKGMIPVNGTPQQGLARLSGAIAYSIIKNGTRLYRDKRYNSIYSDLIEKELEALEKECSAVFELEVDKLHQEKPDNEKIE